MGLSVPFSVHANVLVYILSVITLFTGLSLWLAFSNGRAGEWKHCLKRSAAIFRELTVCSMGYSVFLFVITLVVGIALWLALLGLIYLPADILHNTLGEDWARSIVSTITPYINRSSQSPGFLHQPILDYATLSVLIFAPLAAAWTAIKKNKQNLNSLRSQSLN
jgi:hypothetical protein